MTGETVSTPGAAPSRAETGRSSGPSVEGESARVIRPSGAKSRLDQTKDDTDEGWGDWREAEDRDRWLEEQRPPHWG